MSPQIILKVFAFFTGNCVLPCKESSKRWACGFARQSLLFCKAKLAVLQGKACCFARLSLLFCKAASSQLLPCSSNIWVINFFASDFMKILMSKWNYACKYFFFAVIIIGLLSSESKFVYFKCFFCWPHVLSPMVDYSCRLDYSIRLNCNLRIFLDKWR